MKKILLFVFSAVMAFLFSSCADSVPASTVNSAGELEGKTIGVLEGTVASHYAAGLGTLRLYSTGEAMIADLRAGAIDCAIADDAVTSTLLGHSRKVIALDEPFISVDFCIVAAKESRDLLTAMDKALTELRANGTLAGLEGLYLSGTPYEYVPREDIPATAGTLRLAAPPDFSPYSDLDERGEFSGLDIALARAICDTLGVNLEIIETNQASIAKTVWSSKADFGMGGLYKTGANAEFVDFSDGYTPCRLQIITRK